MGTRNGVRMGTAITQWKKKNPLSSLIARIISKVGGFAGGIMLILGCLGLIAGSAMKNGPDFGAMVGLAVGGLAVDIGSHWIASRLIRNFQPNKTDLNQDGSVFVRPATARLSKAC